MRRSNWRRVTSAVLAVSVAVVAGLAALAERPAVSSASPPVLVAAGDIEGCGSGEATAKVIGGIDGAVAALGDNAYPSGSPSDYKQCYDPSWGRFKDRTHPVPGNHDYDTPKAAGYFGYFGAAAGPAGQGWYSYDLGSWHVVALNSNCGSVDCGAESRWLDSDLSAHPAACTLAYWHHPRYSSGSAGDNPTMNDFWKPLYDHGATVVLSGHDHDYERFAPQDPAGHQDPGRGIRQFVAGTGGGAPGSFFGRSANSEVRNNHTFGVLQLTLRPDGYDWRFVPASGGGFTDSGSDTCHGSGPTPTSAPPAAPIASDTAPGPEPVTTTAPPPVPGPADAAPDWRRDRSNEVAPPATATPRASGGAPVTGGPSTAGRPRPGSSSAAPPGAGTATGTPLAPPRPLESPPPAPTLPTSPPRRGDAVGQPGSATLPPDPDVSLVAAISDLGRPPSNRPSPAQTPLAMVAAAAVLADGGLLFYAGRRRRARVGNGG